MSTNTLDLKIQKYVPTEITADISDLSKEEHEVLQKLIQAGKIVDQIFLTQGWSGNPSLWEKLKLDLSDDGIKKRRYFWINRGPWCILEEHKPFIEGVGPHPKGANFYPEDATKDELEKWIQSLGEEDKKKAQGFFTTIRRGEDGQFTLIPYNQEYKPYLESLSQILSESASLTQKINPSLARYLSTRAAAFLSNDYYESDVAWLEISNDSKLDVTIGPYEVYADQLFNYKATFEFFIGLRDIKSTQEIQKFSENLQDVENHLPIDDKYKNPKIGSYSPIVAVNQVFSAGDVGGPQTVAFNLPNDERVVSTFGTKQVIFKNVQESKFSSIMVPIAHVMLEEEQLKYLSFEAFFTHTLCHELVHGLGPHNITINGKQTTVRIQMEEIHSPLEEAKADIAGLFALKYFIEKGVLEKEKERLFYVTFLVGAFRSIRFGLEEAHGKGHALQLSYLLEQGGFVYNPSSKKYSVNFEKIASGVETLSHEIITIQAEANKARGQSLLNKYARYTEEVKDTLKLLEKIPTDILPSFPLADK